MSAYDLNEQQLAAVEAGGEVFVSAGRRHGQDGGARRARRPRGHRARARRRLDPRDHLHAPRCRRAAHADPRCPGRPRPPRPRARARRRVDLDDPRLLRAPPSGLSARRGPRPALSRARRGTGRGAPLGGVRRGARGVLRRGRSAAARAARHLRERPAAADADERLRDAPRGGAGARPRRGPAAGARREGGRAARRRELARCRIPTRPRRSSGRPPSCSSCWRATRVRTD